MISRKKFLSLTGLSAAAFITNKKAVEIALPNAETELGKVKIKDIKVAPVMIKNYKTHLVKVETDSGLYGIGEAFPKTEVEDDIYNIKKEIIGEDPLNVEVLQQKLVQNFISRGSFTGELCGAISGIEIALWDLAGKILNIPVYILLGGKYRDKILIYHDAESGKSSDPKSWVEAAHKSLSFGFKAIKLSLPRYEGEKWNRSLSIGNMKKWAKIIETVRLLIGPNFPLAVDLHWKYNEIDVLSFTRMIEDYNVWFLEDPLPVGNEDAFVRLTNETKVPILTGENLYTRYEFRPYIEKGACNYIQPDPQKCGGLLETKKIADWGDIYGIGMFCHNGCTPVGTTASAHACSSIKNFIALESDSVEVPYWQNFIQHEKPLYEDGYLKLSNKPGLGIELNEDVCRKHLAPGGKFFD